MRQVVLIHGGDTFNSYDKYLRFLRRFQIDFEDYTSGKKGWKATLGEKLGDDFQVIAPSMPCKYNAKYVEWQIWFKKFVPHLAGEVVLVGHSLGGLFLVKYLSENKFQKNIKGVFLVAPPYDAKDVDYDLADFGLPKKLDLQTETTMIYHSDDDDTVPIKDLSKYSSQIPNATIKQFTDRGHFRGEEFPELVEDIKSLY